MRGGLLASNFTTSAITVAGVRGLCRVGAPRWPVLEATIASAHQVRACGLEHVSGPFGVGSWCTACLLGVTETLQLLILSNHALICISCSQTKSATVTA